ncbi:magnesium-dependent phosphatase 1-like isoform X2 [Corticium candelabrum]|uniref:magnesium-dependent phosphatase 1-like isoform X2 n=1 Tax=Corticium candelabrum TaxID=121492 RepID=UPI002E264A24|nr:magnesium-dependent phosphatase 1-like isoform X2 [Corticium candelabrum]
MTLARRRNEPELIVFDLDYTLWPFWVDTHVSPPFKSDGKGGAYDRNNYHIELYPDVRDLLNELAEKEIKLAAASRTEAPAAAHDLLKELNMDNYFHYKEIYPGSKTAHFKRFRAMSGVRYIDMLFFDDEQRNITDISRLGVTCALVHTGLTRHAFHTAMDEFIRTRQT